VLEDNLGLAREDLGYIPFQDIGRDDFILGDQVFVETRGPDGLEILYGTFRDGAKNAAVYAVNVS
jgi:hypothetical protein